jgi:hypothetical protein
MKRIYVFSVIFSLAMAAGVATAFAQEKNPVTAAVREILPREQKNITAAVQEMPADKYGFKPTPDQMTFGHLALHIAEANNFLCGKIGNMPPPPAKEPAESEKDLLVAAVTRSFEFCDAALAKMDDSKLGEPVELFGGHQGTRASAMIRLASGWADHYSAAAQYLRLNGLLPPSAEPKK